MPPRRKRAVQGSSSSAPPEKKARENVLAEHRPILAERNVKLVVVHLPSPALDTLRAYVRANGLIELASENEGFNETLVREFYGSFPDHITRKTKEVTFKLRGRKIVLNAKALETVLGLPHVTDTQVKAYTIAMNDLSSDDLLNASYVNRASFDTQTNTNLISGQMKDVYRAFWMFARNNLIPTTQHSEVPLDTCRLITLMIRGHRHIPFGKIILESIMGSAIKGRLFFPTLVTKFCVKNKVTKLGADKWEGSFGLLDEKEFRKSTTIVRGHNPPPPPQGAAAPPPIPFDVTKVDPNLYALIHHFHSQTMARFDQMDVRLDGFDTRFTHMEDLIGQITDLDEAFEVRGTGNEGGGNDDPVS